jgi:hypothetical protein
MQEMRQKKNYVYHSLPDYVAIGYGSNGKLRNRHNAGDHPTASASTTARKRLFTSPVYRLPDIATQQKSPIV